MGDLASSYVLKFLTGVLLIAIIAVIVSKNSKASAVIQSISSAFSNVLGTVVSPITAPASTSPANASAANGSSTATTPNTNSATSGNNATEAH